MIHRAYNFTFRPATEKTPCENLSFDDNIVSNKTLYYSQGDFLDMSLVFVYKGENRIILASESRSTRIIDNHVNYIDGFKKIIYLKQADLALITAGPNVINGQNITDFFLSVEDKLINKDVKESLKILADNINQEQFGDNILLISANRFKDKPESFSIDLAKAKEYKINEIAALWYNDCKTLDLFIEGKDLLIPDFGTFSEEQIIDFLNYLIKSEQKYKEYTGQINSLGGKIQFLVMDKYGVREFLL